MKQLSIAELKDYIKKLYALSNDGKYVSAFIWGPPGVGKSAAVKQAAEELSVGFLDVRVAQMNPVDMRGLPTINKATGQAKWLTPDFFPREGKGILFLDEMNLAPQSVMNAGYQLILDRALGDYSLPAGWIIVAAGNRVEDTSNTTKMVPPLANRFVHLEVKNPDVDEWVMWAVRNGVHEQIVAFIKKMPQHLFRAPAIADKAWPSPRSWQFASSLHAMGESVEAAVGTGTAVEFDAFRKVYSKIPDIEAILEGDKKAKGYFMPDKKELDVLWATSMAIVYRAETKHWKNVYAYIKDMNTEFKVLVIKLLDDKGAEWRQKLVWSPEFKKFTKENEELFAPEWLYVCRTLDSSPKGRS